MPNEHEIDSERVHHHWDAALAPSLLIESGDVVHFDLRMAGHGQISREGPADAAALDVETLYHLLGPVHVEGAVPGDALEVEVVALTPGDWGWAAIVPGLGLLPEDFQDPYVKRFDLTRGDYTFLCKGVRLPIRPFLGTMGTDPAEGGRSLPFPPHRGGGNIDTRHLTVGSVLRLPVWSEGARFSCGDPHAAQGDGEVCVTAIECAMRATLRFRLVKGEAGVPSFRVPSGRDSFSFSGEAHATMGIAPDLMEGARIAVRAMIEWIVREHGTSREDAYMLCSLAGDLRIFEIVDAAMWNVGFVLPLDVFTDE